MAANYYVGSEPTIQVTCKDTVVASAGTKTYTFPAAGQAGALDQEGDLEIQIIIKNSASGPVLKSDFIRRRVIKALA